MPLVHILFINSSGNNDLSNYIIIQDTNYGSVTISASDSYMITASVPSVPEGYTRLFYTLYTSGSTWAYVVCINNIWLRNVSAYDTTVNVGRYDVYVRDL